MASLPSRTLEFLYRTQFASLDSGIIINDSFATEYGRTDPVIKITRSFKFAIKAVAKDFHVESLHANVKPFLLALIFDAIARIGETMMIRHSLKLKICARLKRGNLSNQMKALKTKWKDIVPDGEFQFSFVDEKVQEQYVEDQRTS